MVVANPGMGKSFQSGRIPRTSNMATSHAKAPKPARRMRRSQARGREAVWLAAACKKRSRALADGRSRILMGHSFLPVCQAARATPRTRGGLAASRRLCWCP